VRLPFDLHSSSYQVSAASGEALLRLPLLIFGKLVEDVWDDEGFDWVPLVYSFIATPARDAVVVFITRLGSIR